MEFPSRHTTATSAGGATGGAGGPEGSARRGIYVNTAFVKSSHGMFKIVHMVLCLLVFICTMATGFGFNRTHAANWLSFVSMGGFWASALLLFLFVINVVEYLSLVHWVLVELIYTSAWTFCMFVSGIVAADTSSKVYGSGAHSGFGAAAFFAFVAMCVYGYNAFLLFGFYQQGVRMFLITAEVTSPPPVHTPPGGTHISHPSPPQKY